MADSTITLTFALDERQRNRVERLSEFIRGSLLDFTTEGRFALAAKMAQLFEPEFEELKRRASRQNPHTV